MYNHLLDTFIIVAQTGSFKKASEELFISSTSIMKQMNKLEKDLDLKLFHRTAQGVKLTSQGEYILKSSKELIRISHNMIQEAKQLTYDKKTHIKIGTSELFSSKTLSELWNVIQIDYPEYELEFVPFEDSIKGQLQAFSKLGSKYTLIIGTYLSSFMGTRYNTMKLSEIPLCIGVPVNNNLYHQVSLNICDLYQQKIMIVKKGISKYLDNARTILEQHNEIILIDTDEYDINIFNQCVKRNMIMITSPNWKDIHPMIKIIPVNWDCKLPYGIIYSLNPDSETLNFIHTITDIFKTYQYSIV
ncbi:MAG: LysR family transcriptional regulator [Coprobacillus cateniformis]|uniref:LysR family transcriptional regulator n=1 Tax=Longibaculum muris TaxID=1796628 RepID=UPI003AB65130|nr:LysR family transcriptional regulator [Coprobacillus cateniformis]